MLTDLPMYFILIGLAAYIVLAGADFGAGFWTLFCGRRGIDRQTSVEFLHRGMGPVWEANHVWLIFILVICWTAYPVAFASITSTLAVPLLISAIGIILRGTSYALRGHYHSMPRRQLLSDRVFALSSVLTPFALGAAIGGIASGRVPVGNAAGNLVTSWLNPTSLLIGSLSVATSSYLAAIYLAADATRRGEQNWVDVYRRRALSAGSVAGTLAVIGLWVLRVDSRAIFDGLASGKGVLLLCLSVIAGLATIVLVCRSHFNWARMSAPVAVASIVAGWAMAQRPLLLPGLTVSQAAAGRSTLIAVVISVALGAIVLVPSLFLLFGLFLKGRLDPISEAAAPARKAPRIIRSHHRWLTGFIITTFLLGTGGTVLCSGWRQVMGICCLCVFAGSTFVLAATADLGPAVGDEGQPRCTDHE